MTAVLYAAAGTGFTFFMTALGASLVFFFRGSVNPTAQRAFLGFAAGVISALAEGETLEEATFRGNVIGAIQITHRSDNEGLPTREELSKIILAGIA